MSPTVSDCTHIHHIPSYGWYKSTRLTICFTLLLLLLSQCINHCLSIDCFKCTSFGGQNSWCEDPFHHNYSTTLLHTPCWAGRKGRDGLFPASACIKLNGRFEDTGETMMVRDCALDSGSLTTDTELVRMSHCGAFLFDNRYVHGCVQSCFDDACNHSSQRSMTTNIKIVFIIATIIIIIMVVFSSLID